MSLFTLVHIYTYNHHTSMQSFHFLSLENILPLPSVHTLSVSINYLSMLSYNPIVFSRIYTSSIIPITFIPRFNIPFTLTYYHNRLELMKHVFSQRIINDWNSLPKLVITRKSRNIFKPCLDSFWYEEQYKAP